MGRSNRGRRGGRTIPFTPFHFGPGLLLKAVVPGRFWFTSFAAANVLIDVEVLFHWWRGDPQIHRHLHSYVGTLHIGCALAGFFGLVFWMLLRQRY